IRMFPGVVPRNFVNSTSNASQFVKYEFRITMPWPDITCRQSTWSPDPGRRRKFRIVTWSNTMSRGSGADDDAVLTWFPLLQDRPRPSTTPPITRTWEAEVMNTELEDEMLRRVTFAAPRSTLQPPVVTRLRSSRLLASIRTSPNRAPAPTNVT